LIFTIFSINANSHTLNQHFAQQTHVLKFAKRRKCQRATDNYLTSFA